MLPCILTFKCLKISSVKNVFAYLKNFPALNVVAFWGYTNSHALCIFCVSLGLWVPSLLEGSIVLCCWRRQEGICVRAQVCGNVEKVRQCSFLSESLTLMSAALVFNSDSVMECLWLQALAKCSNFAQNCFVCAMNAFVLIWASQNSSEMATGHWWKYLGTSLYEYSCTAVGQKRLSMNCEVLFFWANESGVLHLERAV